VYLVYTLLRTFLAVVSGTYEKVAGGFVTNSQKYSYSIVRDLTFLAVVSEAYEKVAGSRV